MTRKISGVPTSITAFVGKTALGDMHAPTLCRSFADFERIFGGLWCESELGYSVHHFFENGGREALVVRVIHESLVPIRCGQVGRGRLRQVEWSQGLLQGLTRSMEFGRLRRGSDLVGALGLTTELGAAEVAQLHAAGVNALMSRPGVGPLICGDRTGQGTEFGTGETRLIESRLAFHVIDSIRCGTRWAEHQQNDETLWAELQRLIEEFLRELYRKGAFKGDTERDAFYVKCNATTTSAASIQRGVVRVEIGYAVVGPGEFTRLYINLRAGRQAESE